MRHARLLTIAVLGLPWSPARGDEPPGALEVVNPGPEFVAADINGRGEVVGLGWVEEPEGSGIVAQVPFFSADGEMTRIPLLEGYTTTFPAAVSDDGLVVGRVSKPLVPEARTFMQNQAFVWDSAGGIRGLGVLEGDLSSIASGISADGRRISGYGIGPNRMRPCVWDRDGDGWKGTPLPLESQLGSNVVAISDDGRYVAAVDGGLPCLWSSDGEGGWTREVIGGAGSLIPRAVNNSGMVVGLRSTSDGLTHAVVWTRDGSIELLQEPEGFVRSEASAVNNEGGVVGMVDGPNGSDIWPRAFVSEGGRLRLIDEGGPLFSSATAINDRGQVAGIVEAEEEETPETPVP